MKLISACMMVKNEEEFLPQCLNSLIGSIDELCIIDTGSTDSTVKIIKDFALGTHGIRVRFQEIPWNGDFSWMRNESIKMAKTQLVFVIDADEKLRFENPAHPKWFRSEMRRVLESNKGVKSFALTLNDWHGDRCVMKCATARIFTTDVRYEGIIHNTPKIDSDSALLMGCYLDHYGYALSEAKMQAKFERTYNSLMKQLTEDPESPHTEFYLCQLYGTRQMMPEATEWGEKYIARYTRGNQINTTINPTVFYSLGRMYVESGRLDDADRMCHMGLALNQDDPDLFIVKSDIHAKRGQLLEMASASKMHILIADRLQKQGITGKFYFSMNEDTRFTALQRIAIGAIGEGLNAAMSLLSSEGKVNPVIIEGFRQQLRDWNMESVLEDLCGRAARQAE